MEIDKEKYFTIAQFGDLNKLKDKIKKSNDNLDIIKNLIDKKNMSILEKSLSFRKFDIAKFLLENGVNINIVSDEGYNELHYIASNIASEGALDVAKILLNKEVDINSKDKLGNSPLWYLCNEAMKSDNSDIYAFIEECFKWEPDIITKNNFGYSIKDIIINRENKRLLVLVGG